MEGFALSERWNGWEDLDLVIEAARTAVAEGPLDPLVCVVTLESDEDTLTLDSLEELQALLNAGEDPLSMEIFVAYEVPEEANLTLVFNGRWLQINGAGSDWERSRNAYYAAQAPLATAYGITTFKLPKLPYDTVAETRRKLEPPPPPPPQD